MISAHVLRTKSTNQKMAKIEQALVHCRHILEAYFKSNLIKNPSLFSMKHRGVCLDSQHNLHTIPFLDSISYTQYYFFHHEHRNIIPHVNKGI